MNSQGMEQAVVRSRILIKEELITQHSCASGKRISEDLVIVPEPLGSPPELEVESEIAPQLSLDHVDRGPVLFCKKHVQAYAQSSQLPELVDQGRNPMARPGPLSVLPKALFVDIDDDRNRRWISRADNLHQEIIGPIIEEIRKAGVKNAQKKEENRKDDSIEKYRWVIFSVAANDRFSVFRGRHMPTIIWKELFRTISPAGLSLWPRWKPGKDAQRASHLILNPQSCTDGKTSFPPAT
jgi:hypothetical protein